MPGLVHDSEKLAIVTNRPVGMFLEITVQSPEGVVKNDEEKKKTGWTSMTAEKHSLRRFRVIQEKVRESFAALWYNHQIV